MKNLRPELERLKAAVAARSARTAPAHRPDVLAGAFPEARAFIDDPAYSELKGTRKDCAEADVLD